MNNSRREELRIEELLKERNLTKVQLATLMGTYKENLNGKLKSPSFPTLSAIADALGVPMWRLFATPEEVCSNSDFFAVVKRGGKTFIFENSAELKAYCDGL